MDINKILGITDSHEAPERIMQILMNKKERERIFKEMLKLFNYKTDIDWFHEYFQEHLANKKGMGQVFTPMEVARLLTKIVNSNEENSSGFYYEPCAGTGGICIAQWVAHKEQCSDYKPSMFLYTLEELSAQVLPFLIFNLAIRGMNAIVIHCDTLTRESYGVFFIHNKEDDYMQFSNINVMPYIPEIEHFLRIKFIDQRYKDYFKP